MFDKLETRPATSGDLPSLCGWPETEQQLFSFAPALKYPLTVDQLEQTLKKRLHNSVLVNGNALLGFANFYDYKKDDYCFIGNVIVNPQQRGRGYGRALMSKMMEIAFDQYCLQGVRVSVFKYNFAALNLYESLGFKVYDTEIRSDFRNQTVVLLHMNCGFKDFAKQNE